MFERAELEALVDINPFSLAGACSDRAPSLGLDLVTPRLKKEGSCPAKSSYEQAKLENDVVARRILGFLAHCDGVVRLRDCDGKIALVQLLFEAFKGVLRCA